MFSNLFFRESCCLWDNVKNYYTARQSIHDNMAYAYCIPNTSKTLSEYVIIFAFPLRQWLNEHKSALRHTYTACLSHLLWSRFIPFNSAEVKADYLTSSEYTKNSHADDFKTLQTDSFTFCFENVVYLPLFFNSFSRTHCVSFWRQEWDAPKSFAAWLLISQKLW